MKNCISIIIKTFFLHMLIGFTMQNNREKKISDVNVLLPICETGTCSKVTYTLYAYEGCFEWTIDKYGYLEMQQVQSKTEPQGCHHKVIISPKTNKMNEVVWLTARDVRTNEQLRCRIGFNKVDHLRIEKRFDRMNVGDVVEVKVIGYDEKDNMFSSLDGYRFHWKIIDGSSVELHKIHHDNKRISYNIEQKYFSDVVILKGISTGKVSFSAQLIEEDYKEVISQDRSVYVVDPFVILPKEPLYILPKNTFNFDLFLINQNRKVLPSERKFYFWNLEGPGRVEGFGNYFSSDEIGTSRITASDIRIDMFNNAESLIHIVHPTDLDIGIMEINEKETINLIMDKKQVRSFIMDNMKRFKFISSWKLVEGRSYLIQNFLMHEGHPISYILESQKYDFYLPDLSKYSDLTCFNNNMEICLLTIKESTAKEYLHLESVFISETEEELKTVKTVKIFPRLRIEKFGRESFSLPYLGYGDHQNSIKSQELRLKIKGGTGLYYLETSNDDVIHVSDLVLYGKNLGKATIKVVDTQIDSNYDEIEINVLEIKDLTYLEERQEVAIGSNFYVNPVALREFTTDHNPFDLNFFLDNSFTNCTNLMMDVHLSLKDKNLTQIQDTQESENSNYQKIISILRENKKALTQKLKFFNLKDDSEIADYLNYSNFGVCDSKGFHGDKEGLIKLSLTINIFAKATTEKQINNKIISPTNAQVYIYSPLELVSTKLDDEFTKELLQKGNIQNPHNNREFILAYYAGVTLKFSGGVIPWLDQQEDFTEVKYVIERAKGRTFSIEEIKNKIKIHKSISKKEFYLECYGENMENEIVIAYSNKPSPVLLRPGLTLSTVRIGCNYPQNISMFLLGKKFDSTSHSSLMNENDLNEVFTIPQKEGIEYYEKKNSMELIRLYAFDENKRMFYNITTVTGDLSSKPTNMKLFDLVSLRDYNKYLQDLNKDGNYPSLNLDSQHSEYINIAIHFANFLSKLELYYTLKKNAVSQHVKINLIDFPILEPSNSTLYMTHDNLMVIDIVNGSGDFDISLSDNSLAELLYDHVERKIQIKPKYQGILRVHLKDRKIGDNFVVTSTVYISTVKRISLVGGGYLMVNNTMNVSIKVYNNYDQLFPIEQVKKIPLNFKDKSHIDQGMEIIYPDEDKKLTSYFTIKGLIADRYSIIIEDRNSNVASNIIKVELFDKLEVFPPYLLMVPGSSYTLSIRGGPAHEENIIKEYEITDKNIASVDFVEPEVKAHLIGKTTLKIRIIVKHDYNKFYTEEHDLPASNRTEILTLEEIPVRVDFPESVEIFGSFSRKIFTKSTIKLLAALKKENEVFTYGTGPYKFDWAIDNTMIAKIRYFNHKKSECPSSSRDSCVISSIEKNYNLQNSIGVFMKTYDQGTVEVKLTVTITYPDPYTWRRPCTFSKLEKILISDEIYVDIPEFYENDPNKSSLYLIPMDIDHELHTNKNKNFKYSLISQVNKDANNPECQGDENDNVISLTDKGRVTSHHKRGLAYVMINRPKENEKDKAPFVPVVLPIYVTDFYSIFVERSYQLMEMEIGQEVSMKVILQHEYGLLFAERFDRFNLRVVESHPKIAKTELADFNSKLKIKANSQGTTNIIIFNPVSRKIYDVFRITVYSSVILPERIFLNLGGYVSFLSKDPSRKSMLSQDAEWILDDPSILKLDPVEGEAVGLREGITKVHLVSKDRSKVKLSTTVRVGKVKHASIDRKNLPKILTDIKSSPYYKKEYRVPIKLFLDEMENQELSADATDSINSIDQRLNFKCISNQPEIFIAESDKNSLKNEYKECIISIRDYGYNTNIPATLEMKVVAESQTEYKDDKYIYETLVKLPFTSAFKIKNNIKEMTFSRNNRTNYIYLDNIQDLTIDVQDESVVKVEEDIDNKNIKLYVPYNVTSDFHDVKLSLTNKLTNQKEEISLNYIHEKEEEPTRIFFGLVKRSTFIDFLTLILLISIIYILYSYLTFANEERGKVIGPTTPSNRPMGSGVRGTLNFNNY